ncbi:type 2 lanthipeptide synthetase LanM family protein [Mycobacterium sp. NPDC051804]|uniref:type 2 lanthipeptide synthetase LanM family protein n=1 Tax=Mycobacterium sp. NPDC051804 TaxID=3364295 RepID=UPI00378A1305
MRSGFERELSRAATLDDLLSDAHEPLPGQAADADTSDLRLAAWCHAAASGDWSLFTDRLSRDGWSIEGVRTRLGDVRRNPRVPAPAWVTDAEWVGVALQRGGDGDVLQGNTKVAFAPLLAPLVAEAQKRLWSTADPNALTLLTDGAATDLAATLMNQLSDLVSPALFEQFATAGSFGDFVADMTDDGFHRLFGDKPVLLRLLTSLTVQWIETSRELIHRLAEDLAAVRGTLVGADRDCRVVTIAGGLSDPHNFGRTVRIIGFDDGARIVYKPKHLGVDAAWTALVDRLNRRAPPVELRAMRVLTRTGYGWTEFIEHTSCTEPEEFSEFFRRAGAWLAMFHVFVGVDMHQENIIATGSHPVPIDLEMILQAADTRVGDSGVAFSSAMQKVLDSVVTVGLLPAYGRHSTSKVFVIGGVHSDFSPRVSLRWLDVNTDAMRPVKIADTSNTVANLPYVGTRRARLGDHLDGLIAGFDDYARFLHRQSPRDLLHDFSDLPIRTVIRPTRFYTGLLSRLRDHRTMNDGAIWSAQADFTARLADWDSESDPLWALQRAERTALVDLNVPHFTTTSDGHTLRDALGTSVDLEVSPGLERATARLRGLTDDEIAWQVEVIRQSTDLLRPRPAVDIGPLASDLHAEQEFLAEADKLAATLAHLAVRGASSAAWIGLDWLGDSEVSQLVVLGPDLYNGNCGIAVFLAAHSAVTGDDASAALAGDAVAGLRSHLAGRNPARMARTLGLGGGLGLGSIIYGLAVIGALLEDDAILEDAHRCAGLITDDLIAADRQLDVLGGSAGAILGLLRLYRQTGDDAALRTAEKCGRALMAHHRVGDKGVRTWASPGFGRPLNGISHGAAGYAYSMSVLAAATGNGEFASPVTECLAYEESTYDDAQHGWADLRDTADAPFPCKWCYGAPGIGLARIAMTKFAGAPVSSYATDIEHAATSVQRHWPVPTDTLCCGTLGSVEFLREAADALGRDDLRVLATRQLLTVVLAARAADDYRWSSGTGRFNLGMFRGLAGIGYTMMREAHPTLPNVLIWE